MLVAVGIPVARDPPLGAEGHGEEGIGVHVSMIPDPTHPRGDARAWEAHGFTSEERAVPVLRGSNLPTPLAFSWKPQAVPTSPPCRISAARATHTIQRGGLKKQVIEGRVYRILTDLRKALKDFVDLYNRHWRLEKLGGHSPEEARQAWLNQQVA